MVVNAKSVRGGKVTFDCPFCRLVPNNNGTLLRRLKRKVHFHGINKGESMVRRSPHCPDRDGVPRAMHPDMVEIHVPDKWVPR